MCKVQLVYWVQHVVGFTLRVLMDFGSPKPLVLRPLKQLGVWYGDTRVLLTKPQDAQGNLVIDSTCSDGRQHKPFGLWSVRGGSQLKMLRAQDDKTG